MPTSMLDHRHSSNLSPPAHLSPGGSDFPQANPLGWRLASRYFDWPCCRMRPSWAVEATKRPPAVKNWPRTRPRAP